MADLNTRISDFVWKNLNEKHVNGKTDPFWESLRSTGSEIWLDTGDIEEAEANWSSEMSALTTNNSLLNNEIQKGIHDVFIYESKNIVRDLPGEERVKEIAFILNARHGLMLAQKFRCKISIELHTDTAHDIKAIYNYGRRYHEICPEQFIIKIPFSAEGLIGARMLRDSGVKVNLTLGFSARQNVLVTRVARPDYVNVFIGRISAYLNENNLGNGSGAGEMAVIASQNWIKNLSEENPWPTRQIAASLRDHRQIESLAGINILTIPPKVAATGHNEIKRNLKPGINNNFEVNINESGKDAQIDKFWKVDENVLNFSSKLCSKIPATGSEIVKLAQEMGCEDLFPLLTKEEKGYIASDGKIPVHSRWEKKIGEGKIAPDSLLNLAGLAAFTADQRMLDERIRNIIE
jgi:transaldolase